MRFNIARQKLLALGVQADEIANLPQSPDGSLRSQNVRAPVSGRLAERRSARNRRRAGHRNGLLSSSI
jgi:cobalt-zinc-cadmium efflux system membrane fusion protein